MGKNKSQEKEAANHKIRNFYPVNSLVVTRNLWQILLSKICLFSNSAQLSIKKFKNSKFTQICGYFFDLVVVVELLLIFRFIKVTKCVCHLWPVL
jgi:hypothetical protein